MSESSPYLPPSSEQTEPRRVRALPSGSPGHDGCAKRANTSPVNAGFTRDDYGKAATAIGPAFLRMLRVQTSAQRSAGHAGCAPSLSIAARVAGGGLTCPRSETLRNRETVRCLCRCGTMPCMLLPEWQEATLAIAVGSKLKVRAPNRRVCLTLVPWRAHKPR